MKTFLPYLLGASLASLTVSPTYAALDPAIVPADARWVLHADLNALRQSEIGHEVLDLIAKKQTVTVGAGVQIDFQKLLATIGKVTAYGSNFQSNPEQIDGTVVVEGTPDLRKIAEGFIAQAQVTQPDRYSEIKGLPFEAYSIGNDLFIGIPKEPIIIASKMKSQLVKAYNVYLHRAPSMQTASSSPLRNLVPTSDDAIVVASSIIPDEGAASQSGPQARLMRMADAGSMVIGEKNQTAFAEAKLIAKSSDMADKLAKILQGLTAMASLAETNNPQLDEFLRSASVERNGLAVVLSVSVSSQRLTSLLKNAFEDQPSLPKPPKPEKPAIEPGNVIAQWTADQNLGSAEPTQATFIDHSIENVRLESGSIISIIGKPDAGEHARIDFVEIQPADGSGTPLKFEAEYMKLQGTYHIEKLPFASGGKVIRADGKNGVAELQFPGAPGNYNIKVRYSDETDGKSVFIVRVEQSPSAPDSADHDSE